MGAAQLTRFFLRKAEVVASPDCALCRGSGMRYFPRMVLCRIGFPLALVCVLIPVHTRAEDGKLRFNRDVRPLLSEYCFHCHGPDAKGRKADLRLDTRDGATNQRKEGGVAVLPGRPEQSLLLQRMTHPESDEIMPPPETKKHPTQAEIALLRRWIAEGAEYEAHWAFLPVKPVKPPEVSASGWVHNPIDAFILHGLEEHGLTPSPEADDATLPRRLHLDLTGLLPSPPEIAAFQKARATDPEGAVARTVQALLESPHHAERWARHWLDQARYADSNGYTIDGDRVMWPYRDWVIRAIGDGMPFDQFTIEQLAGDLLPQPTKAQLIATGFHRNTLINQEGGTDPEQFRNEEVVDRVSTTGAVWLGLTLGCAQCHDHKFDPITQRDFYSFFAFFNSTEDINNIGPTVDLYEGEMFQASTDPALRKSLEAAESRLADLEKSRPLRQKAWEAGLFVDLPSADHPPEPDWTLVRPESLSSEGGASLDLLEDGSVLAGKGGEREVYHVRWVTSVPMEGLRLRLLTHDSLPKKGPGRAGNGNLVLSEVELTADGVSVPFAGASADHAQPGYPASGAIDHDPGTGWAINVGPNAPGPMNADHWASFALTKRLPIGSRIELTLRHEVNANYNTGRFGLDTSPVPPPKTQPPAWQMALKTPLEKRSKEQKKQVEEAFASADQELNRVRAEVDAARKRLGLGPKASSMILRELKTPRSTYVHTRGDFLREDKTQGVLAPDVPGFLPHPSVGAVPATRLDLAKWLVSRENPLTARVTVNRIWMRYFGHGLVETENDFGTQGAYPTHPELLDWLAAWFMDHGWSVRELHQLIATSATYRQASLWRSDLGAADPRNLLLGRQSRIRCDAEIVRDSALAASGLLSPRIGGPPVRPPQPEGVYAFTQNNKGWTADTGANRYRRTLYTRFYRSAPHPMLTTFDAPDFQSVCTRRPRSNTPLQSLTLANDPGFFEFAQGLASRLLREIPGSDHKAVLQRVGRAFLLCYSRTPSDDELGKVVAFQALQARRFAANPEEAGKVAPGELPTGMDRSEAASWTAVARALMNTDEFVTRE